MAIIRLFFYILFFLLTASYQLVAQTYVQGYPTDITQYSQQLAFYNPAASAMHNQWETSLTSKRNTGFWRNNQTYVAYGGFRITPQKAAGFHSLGGTFYYDKEGTYLRRYRGYLLYAYHIALSPHWSLSTGLSVGMMTYQVGDNDYTGGISNTMDGSIGIMLYNQSFYGGITIAQLPENKVQPISETTILSRYLQCTAGKEFELGENYQLKAGLNARIFTQKHDPDIYLQSGLVWNKTIGLYGIYKWDKQASLMFGLEKIEIDGMFFKTFFSYDVTINGDSRYQAFEITLQYLMPEKPKLKTKQKR